MVIGAQRDQVPHIYDNDCPSQEAEKIMREFLALNGLVQIDFALQAESLQLILESREHFAPGTPYVLGCSSPKGDHSVAVKDGLIYDPSITSSEIIGPMSNGYYWVSYFMRPA